jgi:hypothetical protein
MTAGPVPPKVKTRRQLVRAAGVAVGGGSLAGCLSGGDDSTERTTTVDDLGMTLASDAFDDGAPIPTRYTCDGTNESPPLAIDGVPDGTVSLALVADDPDAPQDRPYVHWLVWNLPPGVARLPAAVPRRERVGHLGGAVQGTNSSGDLGYAGPCPPTGDGPHTYRFTLSAIEQELALDPGAKRPALEDAVADVRLAQTRLTGTYER